METGRGDAAAGTWIVRVAAATAEKGDARLRRRGGDARPTKLTHWAARQSPSASNSQAISGAQSAPATMRPEIRSGTHGAAPRRASQS